LDRGAGSWIEERLTGDDAELAQRIWDKSNHDVNPRHIYGSYLFINTYSLLLTDHEGKYNIAEKGTAFLKNDPRTVAGLDEAEGLIELLSILSTKTNAKRADLLTDWSSYLKKYSKYGTDSSHADLQKRSYREYVYPHHFSIECKNWVIFDALRLTANVHAIFSGSVYSELDRILRGLKKEASIKKLINLTKRDMGKIREGHFDTRRKSGATMSLYISMLRNNNAKDWIYGTPLDGNVIGHNAELQVHHFFPRSLLLMHGFESDQINTFANYTIISSC